VSPFNASSLSRLAVSRPCMRCQNAALSDDNSTDELPCLLQRHVFYRAHKHRHFSSVSTRSVSQTRSLSQTLSSSITRSITSTRSITTTRSITPTSSQRTTASSTQTPSARATQTPRPTATQSATVTSSQLFSTLPAASMQSSLSRTVSKPPTQSQSRSQFGTTSATRALSPTQFSRSTTPTGMPSPVSQSQTPSLLLRRTSTASPFRSDSVYRSNALQKGGLHGLRSNPNIGSDLKCSIFRALPVAPKSVHIDAIYDNSDDGPLISSDSSVLSMADTTSCDDSPLSSISSSALLPSGSRRLRELFQFDGCDVYCRIISKSSADMRAVRLFVTSTGASMR